MSIDIPIGWKSYRIDNATNDGFTVLLVLDLMDRAYVGRTSLLCPPSIAHLLRELRPTCFTLSPMDGLITPMHRLTRPRLSLIDIMNHQHDIDVTSELIRTSMCVRAIAYAYVEMQCGYAKSNEADDATRAALRAVLGEDPPAGATIKECIESVAKYIVNGNERCSEHIDACIDTLKRLAV